MTYQEYNDRRNDIVNAYNNGEMNLPDLQYELAKLDRDYESTYPVSTFPDWSKRAEEALAKMKETHRKVKEEWAHAYIDGDKVKVKKGPSGLQLVEMSVLEARLLASEILSITNKQRRKKKMNEHICAVCGETDIKKLTMFNYGVCLCHRCLEISAHSFIHDNAERKLKETEKKKLKDEIAKKIWDEITEKIKKKREADAKKMAKSFEEIGKVIFVERDRQPESINDLKKALDKVKAGLRTYKAMYRNRLGKFTNLMNEHKKLMMEYNNATSGQESLIVRLADAQCDVNRYQKRCDELQEKLESFVKSANGRILAASATGLIVGLILGYFAR